MTRSTALAAPADLAPTLPDDYVSPDVFHARYPDAHRSMHAVRWELRHRHQNGLIDSGAVIERRADPRATRPMLLVSPTRYFSRLREQSRT